MDIFNVVVLLTISFTGTVAASIADIDFVRRREGVEEQFEDGTISFLSIASIRHGFKIFNTLTTSAMRWYAKIDFFITEKMKVLLGLSSFKFIVYYITYIIVKVHVIECFPLYSFMTIFHVYCVSVSHAWLFISIS